MANKLPWFTHDHVARNDEFMQTAMDKFGHFGYAAFFMLLEVIHEHGVGGVVTMPKGRLALNLRSRWPQVHLYLDFCRTAGKIEFKITGDQVELENKKFIERQRKMKSNALSKLHERSGKAPIEGEVDGEGEEKTTTAPSAVDKSAELNALVDAAARRRTEALRTIKLLDMRMPFGGKQNLHIADLEPSYCSWALAKWPTMGDDLKAALKLRIKIKQDELHPQLRRA